MTAYFFETLVLAGLLIGVFAGNAYAYIDPGTGSYVFQVLVSVFIVSMFFMKNFFRNAIMFIKNLFSGKRNDKDGTD